VAPDGRLSLPLVGPIDVRGTDLEEARARITTALAQFVQDPRVDLSVVEYASRRVYLYGEVREPGAYVLDRPLNVYQALSLGGGFTRQADRKKVVLVRGTPEDLEVIVVDGETPEAGGFTALRSDDFIFVRRSGAGRISDEILPYLTGISTSLASAATLLLVEERLD
jgi:polysaccharide export outer membrane protein